MPVLWNSNMYRQKYCFVKKAFLKNMFIKNKELLLKTSQHLRDTRYKLRPSEYDCFKFYEQVSQQLFFRITTWTNLLETQSLSWILESEVANMQ